MLILKPLHVSHQEAPLFSIDIHPDGTRFATGGADQKVQQTIFFLMCIIFIVTMKDS